MRRLAILIAVAGCSAGRGIAPQAPSPVATDRATWQARAAFDSALQTSDTARIARLFAPDAFLIAPNGDSLRGGAAIVQYLAQRSFGAQRIAVSFGREGSLESCVGAAREQLAYTVRLTGADGTASSASGNVSVFWTHDVTGSLKVAWIALNKADMGRRLTGLECPSVDEALWRTWRWAVSVSATGGCSCRVRAAGFTPASKWAFVVPLNLVSAQYHWRRHVVAELATGAITTGPTTGTRYYPNRDYGLTRIGHTGGFLAGLVSYQHGGLQVGGGPVVQLAHWRLRDSLVPFSSGGLPSYHDTTWSQAAVGIAGDLRYSVLVGRRTFVTVRAQVRRFPDAKLPPASPRLSATLDQSVAHVGVGLGMLW